MTTMGAATTTITGMTTIITATTITMRMRCLEAGAWRR